MSTNTQQDIYGYAVLDNIHQLFPELLYDNTIFPNNENDGFGHFLSWLRFRLTHLYPQTFTRERQNYVRNLAPNRRNDYDEWQWLRASRNAPVMTPPRQMIMQRYPAMSPLQASLNTGFWGGERTPLNTIQPNQAMDDGQLSEANRLLQTSIEELLSPLIIPITNRNSITTSIWARFLDPIPVAPTAQEIANATVILASSAVPAETACSICQSHDSPRDISGTPVVSNGWRKLVNCGHMFHKDCIDRWLEGHVLCPNCRSDIRRQTNLNHSATPSVTESAPASPDL